MKLTKLTASFTVTVVTALTLISTLSTRAQTPTTAMVRAIKGTATYSTDGSPEQPLKTGMSLPTGSTITTSADSEVDLFLGARAGVVRVTESSTLALNNLAITETGIDTVVDVQLDLSEGEIFGNVNKLSAASKYEIKLPNGIAGIRGTRYRCSARNTILLFDGSLVFVHIPDTGIPTPYILKAPPAVYFSPSKGIEIATPEQVQQFVDTFTPPRNPLQPTLSKVARDAGVDSRRVGTGDGIPPTFVRPVVVTPTTGK